MKKVLKYLLIVFILFLVAIVAMVVLVIENNLSRDPDATYELRGRYKSSPDGKTYLVIEDDNGGQCGPLLVDKKVWPHVLYSKGEIEPGERNIECGTWMGITVKEGTTYYFNYWGP